MVKACGLTLMAMLAGASAAAAQQAQQDFPEGPGKQTFMQVCGACHDINRARAGYTPQGWRTVMQMMVNFDGAGPQDQIGTLTEYLIKSFPERPRPPAVLIDGPVQRPRSSSGKCRRRARGRMIRSQPGTVRSGTPDR